MRATALLRFGVLCVVGLLTPLALADTTHDDALWQLVRSRRSSRALT